jgi:hypothetical protein
LTLMIAGGLARFQHNRCGGVTEKLGELVNGVIETTLI